MSNLIVVLTIAAVAVAVLSALLMLAVVVGGARLRPTVHPADIPH